MNHIWLLYLYKVELLLISALNELHEEDPTLIDQELNQIIWSLNMYCFSPHIKHPFAVFHVLYHVFTNITDTVVLLIINVNRTNKSETEYAPTFCLI